LTTKCTSRYICSASAYFPWLERESARRFCGSKPLQVLLSFFPHLRPEERRRRRKVYSKLTQEGSASK